VVFTGGFWPIAAWWCATGSRDPGATAAELPGELNWDCTWLRARSISNDGRFVAFYNEVGGLGVYVFDRLTGKTENPGIGLDGGWEAGMSSGAVGNSEMRYVVFDSWSDNLVFGDINDQRDVSCATDPGG